MIKEFCQVLISATSKKEANKIADILVKKRFIAGSLIIRGHSIYWWKERVIEKEYYNLQSFSLIKNKSKIISQVKKIHSDKCPIIVFFEIDGNDEFLKWIKSSIKQK